MKYPIIAVLAGLVSGCVATGYRHETCPIGIQLPFVFIGINGQPAGWCH